MEWKKIDFVEGFENLYEVSDTGRVRRLDSQRELKLIENNNGYHTVYISNKGKTKQLSVSRLVAKAFIENPDNKPEVDHIDTVRTNNSVANLRWVTRMENIHNPITQINYKIAHKGNKYGDKGYRDKILSLRELGFSYNEIAEKLNCAKSTVHYHLKGEGSKNNS